MKTFFYTFVALFFTFLCVPSTFARSGCCSNHGGVVGCKCGDGTPLSATCAKYYPSCNDTVSEDVHENEDNQKIIIPPTATKIPTRIPKPTKIIISLTPEKKLKKKVIPTPTLKLIPTKTRKKMLTPPKKAPLNSSGSATKKAKAE